MVFGFVKKLFKWVGKKNRKEFTIMVLGIDNAGKSTLMAGLTGGNLKRN